MRPPRPSTLPAIVALALLPSCSSAQLEDLEKEDPDDRRVAVTALSIRAVEVDEDRPLRPRVFERAKKLAREDPSPSVRSEAVRALARLGVAGERSREAVLVLAEVLVLARDKSPFVRLDAAEGLSALVARAPSDEEGAKARGEGVGALRRALTADEDRDVRGACARELGLLHAKEAASELVGRLRDEAPDVRFHAHRALVALAGDDRGGRPEDWAKWLKEGAR